MSDRNWNGYGINRRRYIKTAGAATVLALAGCSGNGGGGGGSDGGDGSGGGSDGGGGMTTTSGSSGGGSGTTVGHLAPFSGGLGWIGPNARRGREVALADINEAGVLGGTISINQQDSETNSQAAVSAFNTLDEAGVTSLIGPSSSVMPSLIQPIKDAKLPTISSMSGTTQLNDVGGKYIWRSVPSDSVGGRAQGRYALNNDFQKMVITFKNDRGSESFAQVVGSYFEDNGGTVAAEVPLPTNASSYRSEIEEIVSKDPDIVSMTAATEVSSLFLDAWFNRGLTDTTLFLSNDVITSDFIKKVGADRMAKAKIFGQAPAPGPAIDTFKKAYGKQFDKEPGAFAGATYDAMNLIALAFQKHGEFSRQAVPNTLSDIGNPPGTKVTTFSEGKKELEAGNEINYEGASNPQNFNENGDPLGAFSVVEVADGAWKTVETYSADQLS